MNGPEHIEQTSELDKKYGTKTHTFTLTRIPVGDTSPEAREALVGVVLPIRSRLALANPFYEDAITGDTHGGCTVLMEDVVVALLDNDNQDAANFWGGNFSPEAVLVFHPEAGQIARIES